MSAKSTFRVEGMDCPNEAAIIRKQIEGIQGVAKLEIDIMRREVVVHHADVAGRAVTDALVALNMGAEPVTPGGAMTKVADSDASTSWFRRHLTLWLSGVAAIAAEVVAWSTGEEASPLVGALALAAVVLGGRRPLAKAWVALKTFTLSIDVLMTIAVVGATVIKQWPEAAMVTFLFGVAEAIEGYSLDRARNAIAKLLELAPEQATVERDGKWIEIPAGEVRVGQVVRVRAGERIPLDGKVSAGRSAVDQAPVTGESVPVDKTVGDVVFAGTVNQEGSLDVEVTKPASESTLAQIARAVSQAQGSKPAIERFVDKFAKVYTPIVVLLAVGVLVAGGLFGAGGWQVWGYRALVLLVIACPCALVIATPVTVVSALTGAARRGILVKGGAYLEIARGITTVAVDKTGTITRGQPQVTDTVAFGDATAEEVLGVAASLNAHSDHPIARAIRAAAGDAIQAATDFRNIVGRGVEGRVDGEVAFVGSHRLAEERKVCSPEIEAHLHRLEGEGKSVSVVAQANRAIGVVAVADTIKATSSSAVADLRAMGVEVVMLTGDNARTAKHVATLAGISKVEADLLPDDKLQRIEALATAGHVAMVGDGVNDAPALAKATLGIAMGKAGSDVAIETADVALMQDDLRSVPELIRLGRRAMRTLRGNIAFAIATKAVFFVLAMLGLATLWMAVFADLGASLIVVALGLRLLQQKTEPSEQSPASAHAAGGHDHTHEHEHHHEEKRK